MDRARFSRIAHRFLPISAPLDREGLLDVLKLLPLDRQSRVLDVGCGRASVLVDLLSRCEAHGTGLDCDGEALKVARAAGNAHGCGHRLTVLETNALEASFDSPFDLTLCVGSSHALGGQAAMLEHLARWTRPGGHMLWGEGFWRRAPDAAYIAAIGGSQNDLLTHHGNVAAAHDRGWSLIWSTVTSDSEWDRYEGLYRLGMARYLAENPDDPDAIAFRRRSETWYDGYLRWGRDTMGFASYLFERRDDIAATSRSGL